MYFTFDHPVYLWYLLSIPLLVVTHYAFLKYTRRRALKFANFQALKRVTDDKVVTKNHIILIVRAIIIVCLILAIAGTTLWYKGITNNNDFILAVDTSSSMTAQDFKPTRIGAAKNYLNTFVDNLNSQSNIGVISFSGVAFIEHMPSTNKNEIKTSISEITAAPVGGTDIAGAIITGVNMLIGSKNGKLMILLTDGSNTVSYFTKDPIDEAIKYAKSNSVSVYTIGLGTVGGPIGYLPEYYNVSSVFDETPLQKIANETGATYYYAGNNQELDATYKDILTNTKEAYIPIQMDLILALTALIVIFVEWGLISTRFRGLP
jgi:Ca-activated chloride channel family protein